MEVHDILVALTILWLVIGICSKLWWSIDAGDTASSLNNTLAKAAPPAKREIALGTAASVAIWMISICVGVFCGRSIVASGEESALIVIVLGLSLFAYIPFSLVRWLFKRSLYPRIQLLRASFFLCGLDLWVLLSVM